MAKFFCLLVLAAAVVAEDNDSTRPKKEVLLGTLPYGYNAGVIPQGVVPAVAPIHYAAKPVTAIHYSAEPTVAAAAIHYPAAPATEVHYQAAPATAIHYQAAPATSIHYQAAPAATVVSAAIPANAATHYTPIVPAAVNTVPFNGVPALRSYSVPVASYPHDKAVIF